MGEQRLSASHRAVLHAVKQQHGWASTYGLGLLLPQYTGETVAKKARDLRRWGYLEARKVPDKRTGGIFVEYRIKDQQAPDLSSKPTVAAAPDGGLLFDTQVYLQK